MSVLKHIRLLGDMACTYIYDTHARTSCHDLNRAALQSHRALPCRLLPKPPKLSHKHKANPSYSTSHAVLHVLSFCDRQHIWKSARIVVASRLRCRTTHKGGVRRYRQRNTRVQQITRFVPQIGKVVFPNVNKEKKLGWQLGHLKHRTTRAWMCNRRL